MTRLSFAPLTSRLLQKAAGYRQLEEFACEKVLVCGAEDEAMRPAIFLPGELDRITGVHEFSAGLADEIHMTTRTRVQHSETIAYRMRDICLADRQLCNYRSFKRLTFRRSGWRARLVNEITDCSALSSTDAGNDYFAHFLLDDAATALLGRDFGQVIFAGDGSPRSAHINDYLSVFDIPCRDESLAWFKDLWVFRDYAQNSHRRERMQTLRNRLSARFPTGTAPPAYIRRGAIGRHGRVLENSAEIEECLISMGFAVIDPDIESVEEICNRMSGSPLVIGLEGSQMVHGLLNLAHQGVLLCIQPAARFNAVFRGFTNTLGLNWGFVVADGDVDRSILPVSRLLATVDLAMEQMQKPC